MGLDVYVGSLTRYYAGDWELITQTAAKEMGLQLDVIRQHEPDDTIRDPEEIRQRVIGWRAGLSRDIAEDLKDPLDWDESAAAPYFTDKPAWSCHGDLLLWAAYEEQTHISRPESSVEAWSEDPAFKLSSDEKFASRYSQLYTPVIWLPCPFSFLVDAADVSGHPSRIGSSMELLKQLADLNSRTWFAARELLSQWRHEGSEFGAPLEHGARFALSLMLDLAEKSVQHRLPMLLDW